MSNYIEHTQTDQKGSFVAGGSSLHFDHCASNNLLRVCISQQGDILHKVTLPVRSLCNPLEFVYFFDRITKIKALNFSSNTTVNLSLALQGDKLLTVLENAEQLTRYCMMLQNNEFRDFCRAFCQGNALGSMALKSIPRDRGLSFYSATVTSLNDDTIETTGSSIHSILRELSKAVIQELALSECIYSHHSSAQNLLSVSATLSILSRAVNKNFIPEFQLIPETGDSDAIEA